MRLIHTITPNLINRYESFNLLIVVAQRIDVLMLKKNEEYKDMNGVLDHYWIMVISRAAADTILLEPF